ncbi:far upstream element-binding protein 2, partial [Impatiens glandulifera]|uniref:far upstream element-binding protein 2 n=1 Tax=Impatiens glandulifera TaxID=253017 RepID=UPI001FB065DF
MADEEVLPVPTHAPVDLKRKHEDLEPDCPEILSSDTITDSISKSESLKNPEKEDGNVTNGGASDVLESKRPRLDEKLNVDKNGHQDEKPSFLENKDEKSSSITDEEVAKPIEEDTIQPEDSKKIANDISEKVDEETPSLTTDNQTEENQSLSVTLQPSAEEIEASKTSSHAEVPITDEQSTQTISRKIEVPNNKVGVLIGKSGDTIRSLQNNSNAKIQITRDSEADPNSSMRPVEIIGTLENINKAEKLIKDVIAEADAGGSPALVARGFNNAQSNEAGEQVEIKVPNEKVGLIIGKGGETIKNLQMRSGARIQLIQQHGPDGGEPKERTVRLTGSKRQIEMAREMIDEVMAQPVRSSSQSSGGYGSQGNRSRGPSSGPPQWGSRGGGMRPPQQPTGGYDYNRGPYPNQNQYPSQYGGGGYPQQHVPSRNNYGGPGWDNRPPPQSMQGPHGGGGYDYYGGGQADHHPPPSSTHVQGGPPMGPSHQNYNYGQDYGQQQPGPYSHGPPPAAQGYGGQSHGPPPTYGGGGYGSQQPPPSGSYPQSGVGYPQDQYGKAPPTSYGGQPQGQSGQSYYGQGRGPPVSE